MPERAPNPKFAQSYLRVSALAESRGARDHRRAALAGLTGVVCEIGCGQGLNFAHYPRQVQRVVAVEPEPTLSQHATGAAAAAPVVIEVIDGTAELLPLDDDSCDAVVASLVLCSVPSQQSALAEIARVLRPGGQLRFYEHVRSSHRVVAGLQDVIAPAWAHFAGGCHPNRDTVAVIEACGFEVTALQRFGFSPARGLPPSAHVIGVATAAT